MGFRLMITFLNMFSDLFRRRQLSTSKVVAIKVLDIDETDFRAYGEQKDEQIRDFNREIRILRQAQDSGAENLNRMIEALPVHSQLWLICEYCPGGSVKTLVSHNVFVVFVLLALSSPLSASELMSVSDAGHQRQTL